MLTDLRFAVRSLRKSPGFTLIASLTLAVGIYGVIAYSVARRTRELGIRIIALGAPAAAVLRIVLGQGLALTIGGVLLGVGGALALTRFPSAFLFGVTATDARTLGSVAVLLAAVGVVASQRSTQTRKET